MKGARFFRKNWVPLLILLIVGVIVRNYYYAEGFQTTCPAGKTLKCPTTYPNRNQAICYKACRSGFLFSAGQCTNKDRVGATGTKYRPDSTNAKCS